MRSIIQINRDGQLVEKPVNTIYCVGRNYLKHAQEMQSKLPDAPIIFTKPNSTIVTSEKALSFPIEKGQVHHEVEIVVRIGKTGRHIDKLDAWDHLDAFCVGIDFTLRDLQSDLKAKKLPWLLSKGFDHSAGVTQFQRFNGPTDLESLEFFLDLNGKRKQTGSTADMVFDIPTLIAFLSRTITLREGDLLYTGTPEGVGLVRSGDQISVGIKDGIEETFTVK